MSRAARRTILGDAGTLERAAAEAWPWSEERRAATRDLGRTLAGFADTRDLLSSPWWDEHRATLQALLGRIQSAPPEPPGSAGPVGDPPGARRPAATLSPPGPAGDRFRAVHWNILKGIAFEAIVAELTRHPRLRDADALLLNEVDVGMARSGNRHGAAELARRLGMHWTFLPSYLELTKGPGADARAAGENEIGLHGVAVLTRRAPVSRAAVRLPEIFDYFGFREKRLGQRQALIVTLPGGLALVSVHVEVRNTPAARAAQMCALLDGVDRFCEQEQRADRRVDRVLVAGDLNSHTFARGTPLRAVGGFVRLLCTPRGRLQARLCEPWQSSGEPAFDELAARGYDWRRLNDRLPTAHAPLATIDEARGLPALLAPLAARVLGPDPRGLPLRLDWFAGRGIEPRTAPATLIEVLDRAPAPSDHAPITLEFHP